MQTRLAIKIENFDMARSSHMASAFRLVGGPTENILECKPFSRIAGNDFTMIDAEEALSIIRRLAGEAVSRLEQPIFENSKLQEVFANGVRANANLAIRFAEQFMDDLRADLDEM